MSRKVLPRMYENRKRGLTRTSPSIPNRQHGCRDFLISPGAATPEYLKKPLERVSWRGVDRLLGEYENDAVRLDTVGSLADINRLHEHLVEEMRVVLYEDEFEVDGVLRFDRNWNIWIGIPDWSTKRDRSRDQAP